MALSEDEEFELLSLERERAMALDKAKTDKQAQQIPTVNTQQVPMGSQIDSTVARAVSNIPRSAANFVGGIVDVVKSPVKSTGALLDAAAGGLQNAFYSVAPGLKPAKDNFFYSSGAENTVNAVGRHYKERYGGLENIRNTMIEDPVGFAADASVATGLASAGLRAAGMANAANVTSAVSKAVDPVRAVGKGVAVATKHVVKPALQQVLGRTTGSGPQAIGKALDGSDDFVKAMRDEVDDLGVVEKAQDAFGKIKEARAQTYQNQLKGIASSSKNIDISDVKSAADDWLKRFGIKKTAGGELDFSRSTVSGGAVNDVKAIYDDVINWGNKPGDTNPIMLDTLKRRISDFYTENGKARAMIADLSKKVERKITSEVPEYGKMTSDYAKSSDLLKMTEKAILSKDPKAVDTALRKIMMGVREEKGLRRGLMDDMSKFSDEDIMALASGRVSNPWLTRRLESSIVGTVGVVGGATVAPLMFALMPLASPRLAGEASVLLGRVARTTNKIAQKTPRAVYLAPSQAGQIQQQ